MSFDPIQRRLQSIVRATVLQHQLMFGNGDVFHKVQSSVACSPDSIIAVADEHFVLLRQVERYREHWCAVLQHVGWHCERTFTILLRPSLFAALLQDVLGAYLKAVDSIPHRSLALQLLHLERNKQSCLQWLLRDHYYQLATLWRADLRAGGRQTIHDFIDGRHQLFYQKILSLPDMHDDFSVYRRVVRELVRGMASVHEH